MKMIKIWMAVLCLLCVSGCQKKQAPEVTPSQVLDTYLTAMKAQDGNEMAKYTVSGKGDDFSIHEEDAASIGLSSDVLADFYSYILSFNYTFSDEQIQLEEDRASVTVNLKTYDIMAVLNASVEAHTDEFGEIKGGEGSDEEKQQAIAAILMKDFETAQQTYEANYTFHFSLSEDAWKIMDEDIDGFYQLLLNTSIAEE